MGLLLSAGDTFITISKSIRDHLWIVISDPSVDSEKVLIVNLTTWKEEKDQSCILEEGEHPFISHKSVISYADAQDTSIENLTAVQDSNQIVLRKPVDDAILTRIRDGLWRSPHSKQGHKAILNEQGYGPPD